MRRNNFLCGGGGRPVCLCTHLNKQSFLVIDKLHFCRTLCKSSTVCHLRNCQPNRLFSVSATNKRSRTCGTLICPTQLLVGSSWISIKVVSAPRQNRRASTSPIAVAATILRPPPHLRYLPPAFIPINLTNTSLTTGSPIRGVSIMTAAASRTKK